MGHFGFVNITFPKNSTKIASNPETETPHDWLNVLSSTRDAGGVGVVTHQTAGDVTRTVGELDDVPDWDLEKPLLPVCLVVAERGGPQQRQRHQELHADWDNGHRLGSHWGSHLLCAAGKKKVWARWQESIMSYIEISWKIINISPFLLATPSLSL